MIETLLGGLLGGAFRLTPEILKWIDRKGERTHELAIQDNTIQLGQLRAQNERITAAEKSDAEIKTAELNTFQRAIDSQGTLTQIGWADALSKSVRPIITYWFMALYCTSKTAAFMVYLNADGHFTSAIQHIWTESDQALWAGVLNFWFLGRVFEKQK
ncbi:hypothetical protein GH975_08610 [Litorivicinus lipolyticus]|uniref:Uncharacterized protein n=1 Tax=Litorivicinus lipolyticus TaxID=418701 RepID=A0A5Q2QF42_9GAMM|nr:hypothetical protein [Litorivicinus lipolyticus]QGG80627.1 hypothetical protein GH975_08610 [Litorivicinus lipolyticus]